MATFRVPDAPGYVLYAGKDRPVRIELTDAMIRLFPRTGPMLFECRRTIECAEQLADLLSLQRCVLEADALRRESQRWKW
jgi:hypothetical protein